VGARAPQHQAALGNLAYDFERQGKYGQAEEIDRHNLEARRRVLGPENPNTLVPMTNLAIVYAEQGKFAGAAPLFRQTVDIRRRVMGPEHPETLQSMSNLAEFLRDTGKYPQAEALCSDTRRPNPCCSRATAACWNLETRCGSGPVRHRARPGMDCSALRRLGQAGKGSGVEQEAATFEQLDALKNRTFA